MSISISPEVAALLGAAVGALPSLVVAYMNNRVREREHIREIAIRTAIETWKLTAEHNAKILPLEHYVIHAAQMADLAFSGKKLTPGQIADRLEEIDALLHALARKAQAGSRTGGV